MLTIHCRNRPQIKWESSDDHSIIRNQPEMIDDIIYITADREELTLIINQYTRNFDNKSVVRTIPVPNNRVFVYWYGDIAKTIVANL